MKRILAILCVLAMLLSLPIAPGIVASAEVATAKPTELVNLWTAENRSWGMHQSGNADYDTYYGKSGTTRSNPGHNSSEFIEAKQGDVFYFGPCADQSEYAAYKTTAELSTNTFTWAAKDDNVVVDTFDNGWTIRSFTMPCDGAIAITNNSTVGDAFNLFTKNQPFDCEGYFDHYNNNVYLFNSNGYRLDDAAAEVADANYNTTAYIKVTPGETLTMGPVTADQAYFGYAYDASKTALVPITKAMLTKVDDFDYTIGYYAHMGSGQAGPNKGMSYAINSSAAFYSCVVPEGVSYIRVTFDNTVRTKAMVVRGKMDMAAYQAIEGIDANNPLAGKTALFVGDSVTHATRDYKWAEEGVNYRGWAGRIADANDMLVYNYGRTSSSLSTSRTGDGKTGTIIDQLNNALTAGVDYDYVVLGGGVNDMWDSVPVGTLTGADVKTGFDQTTYAGALEATFAKAIELYGTAAISYIIHPKVLEYGIASLNDTAYAAACAEVARAACAKWGINCIDLLTNETVLNEFCTVIRYDSGSGIINVVKGTDDNLHPNAMGYELLAPIIADGMKQATPLSTEAYVPVPLSESNLWTVENRNWGARYGAGTQYWNGTYAKGGGRKNPGHNSSEWIDVKKGDQIYFGAAYYSMTHINWAPEGTALTASTLTNNNILWLDNFTNGTFKIGVWTAPAAGKVSILNKQNEGNDDYFIITKNRPFSMAEFMDHFNNHVWILEAHGKYVNAAGVETDDANYFTTEFIKVTEGEVLTLGPVVTGAQVHFGHTYDAAKNPMKSIALSDLARKDSFDYATGFYSYSLKGNANGASKNNNTADLYEYYLPAGTDVYTYTVPAGVEYIRATFMTAAKTKAFVLRGDVGIEGYYASMGIEADNPLIGKKALFLGDSITEGAADYAKEGVNRRGWAGRIADQYDMLVDNFGVSSYSFFRTDPKLITDELHAARNNDYDYVIIHGGVNDLSYDNIKMGTVDPEEFNPDNFDLNTFAGAMEATIAKALDQFGDTASFLYVWNFEIKNSNWFTGCDKGCQPKYLPTATAICEKWGIPMVDLFNDEAVRADFYDESTPNDTTELRNNEPKVMDGTYDNVHPNALGYDLLAKVIGDKMETLDPTPYNGEFVPEDKEDTVIALVGDDLTAGFGSTDVYRKSYAGVMQDQLGENYQVLNYGVSNATLQSDQKYSYVHSQLSRYTYDVKADKMVIMLGTYDLKTMDLSIPNAAEKLTDELSAMVQSYKKQFPGVEIYLATPPAATNSTLAAVLPVAASLYQQAAAQLGIQFIDVYAATKDNVKNYISTHALTDGTWYNDTGYAKIAETVMAAMGLTKATAPAVDTTAEYTGTYPSVPTTSQYVADAKYQSYDAYRIVTAADWKAFSDLVASGVTFEGKTVYLENDLDLTDKNVHPVGVTGVAADKSGYRYTGANPDYTKSFKGTFNGNGYTVNYNFRYFNAGVGLFASTYGATITNLNLTGSLLGHELLGSVTAFCDGGTTIKNVWSGVDVTCANIALAYGIGGIASNFRNSSSIYHTGYSGTITGQDYVGALVAYSQANAVAVQNCFFNGKIETGSNDRQTNILVRNASESVHANNYMIADPKNIIPNSNYAATIDETAFATGEAAMKLNKESDIWTVKNGKTVIAGPEDKATFTVTVDGNSYYTNHKGQVSAEFKTETGYFRVDNQLITDAEMSEYQFSKENAILNSVAKLAGDASGDGSFAMDDIIAVMRYLVQHPERVVEVNADYSGNGKINVADCVRMLQSMAAADPVA